MLKIMKTVIFLGICVAFISMSMGGKKQVQQKIKVETNPDHLMSHVVRLTVAPARSIEHPRSLENAAVYIENQFRQAGYKTVESQPYHVGSSRYRNVIAVLNPGKSPVVVVGAHYDVCGEQPGADDNASGVAGLMELAKILQNRTPEIPCQIRFVAYSTEEPPYFRTEHMGSFVHAKSMAEEKVKPALMIALEMIGFFSDRKGSQRYPSILLKPFYPDRGNYIAVVSKFGHHHYLKGLRAAFLENGLKSRTLSAPSFFPGVDFSDHRNYWKFGFKAVMVTDSAFYRNPHYHQPTDTPETLDYPRMAKVVEGLAQYLLTTTF